MEMEGYELWRTENMEAKRIKKMETTKRNQDKTLCLSCRDSTSIKL